jgi:hypothetical protein
MAGMPKLFLRPDQAYYTATQNASEIEQTDVDGGLPRQRLGIMGSVETITMQWTLNVSDHNYLHAFFRKSISRGSLPFVMDLFLESATLEEHTCILVAGSWKITAQQGLAYTTQANVYVVPNPVDTDMDAMIIAQGEADNASSNDLQNDSTLLSVNG